MGARVEPCRAPAHHTDIQFSTLEIGAIDVGNLELSTAGRAQTAGNFDDLPIVKVKSRNRVARLRFLGLLLNAERLAMRVELHNAVALGIVDGISKDACAFFLLRGGAQFFDESVAVENIVAQNERAPAAADELAANQKSLRNAFWLRLHRILKAHPEARSITEQLLEAWKVIRSRDDENVAYARQHERGERVIDHRLVVDGEEALRDCVRHGIKTRAGASREDDALIGW